MSKTTIRITIDKSDILYKFAEEYIQLSKKIRPDYAWTVDAVIQTMATIRLEERIKELRAACPRRNNK